jgi:hypothetical protein
MDQKHCKYILYMIVVNIFYAIRRRQTPTALYTDKNINVSVAYGRRLELLYDMPHTANE